MIEREIARRASRRPADLPLGAGPGGLSLAWNSPYLCWMALLLLLLNVVNTTGEYMLSATLVDTARAVVGSDRAALRAFIGEFYGRYYLWANLAGIVIQVLVASRVVRRFGTAGALVALPLVAFGGYGLLALGVGVATLRWTKLAENSMDYSLMNTGRQLLWLPTSREEKYKAKQAIDTFFVRSGDMLAAGVVFAGTTWLQLSIRGFVFVNVVAILLWLAVTWRVVVWRRRLCATCP